MTLRTLLDRFDLLMDTPESVPKLRRFILRLALQGRLTEQRTEDADIDALVERLRTEKQRLYDEGEIRKPRSLDPLDDGEEWHQVPSEWRWTKVGEVGRIIGGSTPRTSNDEYWADQGIAWLTPGDLGDHDGKMVSRGDRDISEKGLDSCSATLLPPGSVLFSSRAPIGYVAIAADELSTNQGFKSVRPYEMAMSHYIYWFLKYAGKHINDEASGTTFTEVSGTDLANIPFPLPPLEEQQRIVETVDRLMDECDALEQQQERERALQVQVGTATTEALQSADDAEALRPAWERVHEHFDTVTATSEGVDALRQTILQLAVQGRLTERDPDDTPADESLNRIQEGRSKLMDRHKGRRTKLRDPLSPEETPERLPETWACAKLGNLVVLKSGKSIDEGDIAEDGEIPFVKVGDLSSSSGDYYISQSRTYVSPRSKYEGGVIPEGSIMFPKRGGAIKTNKKRISEKDVLIDPNIMSIIPPIGVKTRYLLYWFESFDLSFLNSGTSVPQINNKDIAPLPFPLPPQAEQQRIIDVLDHLLPFCEHLDEHLDNLNERGEQLLEAALRDASMDRQDAVPSGVTA